MRTKTFECRRGNFTVRGTVYLPEEKKAKYPIAILSHGFLSSKAETDRYAPTFVDAGYLTITYDFAGGANKRGKSDGTLKDMTIFTEKDDLKAVIAYATGLSQADANDVTLAGCSQGGFVSGLVAAELQTEIRQLVLLYPALCIPDDARRGKMQAFKFDPQNVPDAIRAFGMELNGDYARSVLDMDAVAEVTKYKGRVLVIHGTKDTAVNHSYAVKAYEAFLMGREDPADGCVQFLSIVGAGHGFPQMKYQNQAKKRIALFLEGKDEVLTIDVQVTGHNMSKENGIRIIHLPFSATADNKYFKGEAKPGAEDIQKWKRWHVLDRNAVYTLKGVDCGGEPCSIKIRNHDSGDGMGWVPTVSTDSKRLDFLNNQQCVTVAENRKGGPIIRIYADPGM